MSDDNLADVAGGGRSGALSALPEVGVLLLNSAVALEFANTLACQLLGCENREQLAARWQDIGRQLDMAAKLRGFAGSRAYRAAVTHGAEAQSLHLEVHALAQDSRSGFLVLMRDHQTVGVLEADLLLASQMRVQNYLYGALIHDLRAPLNAMTITLELLAETVIANSAPAGTAMGERHVGVLREELVRLNRLLGRVLEYGAPLREERRRFDIGELLEDLAALLAAQARHQRIGLQLHLPERRADIEGQRDRIKQALLNIAVNAMDALRAVPDGRLEIDLQLQPGAVVIGFSDTGPGVPQALLDDIYGAYFTTRTDGSGVGLYVARLVVEAHGGDIRAENRPGGGARFAVTLPAIA